MPRRLRVLSSLGMAVCILPLALASPAGAQVPAGCARLLHADVVAFDQVFFWNRLGAVQPQGMMYALRRDVVPISGTTLSAGNVRLRPDKRPRPMVLRMNVGDCIKIDFQNLLASSQRDQEQPATRWASIHAVGMEPVQTINDDGSFVGKNNNAIVNVGQSTSYMLYAGREGEHVINSLGATNGGEGDGGSTNSGLFGAIIVEPANSVWYRSQVTRADLSAATTGSTQYGQPLINYGARYPTGHPRAGQLVLGMLDGTEIVATDLTALIVGTGGQRAGWFPPNQFPPNIYTYPNRHAPFREFTIIYHDEIGAVQAFPQFEEPVLEHTLHGGRDAFAINYGTGGIGAEILANRFRVGPMYNCVECKFEEFFLTSWAVGDPAMIVDVPANSPCGPQTTSPNNTGQDPNLPVFVNNLRTGAACTPLPNAKATKAFFPDDPSNVYHSYLNDHVKFRVLHAGTKEHHIHHLHAHQWLYTADSDKSTYLDSQAIGPGNSFTAEIAYEGSGNQNKTVGDAIFHCHFYPHFAQGMWSLWRVHDVLEIGTALDPSTGRPAAGSRALPDGEIAAGTPIPAVVPLPGMAMAPPPEAAVSISAGQAVISGTGNPGWPFFVPARAGHRPPHPPYDTIDDGGLPRHNITAGTFNEAHTRLDFHKTLLTVTAQQLPELGTAVEQDAMSFHAQGGHLSCEPNNNCANLSCPPNPAQPCTPVTFECEPGPTCIDPLLFRTNGRAAIAGAPYADPCPVEDAYHRTYKAADIQTDVRINKKGWHFPQQRFESLWEDVASYLNPPFGSTKKPPEPLFIRGNSNDCIDFQLTNLVPGEYLQDDFQVRTPTDILGQHIHLVKFDVTASDGAANGFNYEDGSFSPDEVRERINAIRAQNGCAAGDARNGTFTCPVARAHPFFGAGPNNAWLGAQTTVQRWYVDPIRDNAGNDRTMRTVFTHDHFGPSTHQQTGLYAGLVIEPALSTWVHNETGVPFYTRADGGPTSWQAVITPPDGNDYREFLLEFGDFQLAYEEDNAGFPDPDDAVNPPGRREIGIPDLLARPNVCPGGVAPPCPEIISAADPGTMSVNYRQEPLALRVRNPLTNGQATGNAGDLSFAFSSNVTRADTALNVQPNFYAPLTFDLNGRDPWTPLLRAYENDHVQIRILVGAHEEGHNFSVHGIKWLFEPSEPNSGYRNSQMMGISEHFEFIVPQLIKNPTGAFVDRLYSVGSSTDDYWNGIWGLLRAYTGTRQDLVALQTNPNGSSGIDPGAVGAYTFSCPKDAVPRLFDVTAVTAQQALTGGRLVYNNRTDGTAFGPLFDPTAILYVRTSDLLNGQLKAGVPIEPLILRARAGECIKLTLRNNLPDSMFDLNGFNTLPMIVEGFNNNDLLPSKNVGLHPQMLYYDVSKYDAANVGGNLTQTVAPGQFTTYEWYAGDVKINPDGTVTATPIEFGATNLISSDRIKHASKGAIGALIIEPPDAAWVEGGTGCVPPAGGRCTATFADVTSATGPVPSFREFALLFQDDVNMRTDLEMTPMCNVPTGGVVTGFGAPVENLACEEDPEDSGQKAVNYRTEPLWKRMQIPPGTPFTTTRNRTDWFDVVANTKVGTLLTDPQTPVFLATAGQRIRFRVLEPGGHARNHVFALHGHQWDKEPYVQNSTFLGQNGFSFWEGARMGHGPSNHFDALIRDNAGGKFSIIGDYLFRDQVGILFDGGIWGILRVQ